MCSSTLMKDSRHRSCMSATLVSPRSPSIISTYSLRFSAASSTFLGNCLSSNLRDAFITQLFIALKGAKCIRFCLRLSGMCHGRSSVKSTIPLCAQSWISSKECRWKLRCLSSLRNWSFSFLRRSSNQILTATAMKAPIANNSIAHALNVFAYFGKRSSKTKRPNSSNAAPNDILLMSLFLMPQSKIPTAVKSMTLKTIALIVSLATSILYHSKKVRSISKLDVETWRARPKRGLCSQCLPGIGSPK